MNSYQSNITPIVSVIMPSYNVYRFVEASIRSVLNQTFKNLELLVVDDGSTDSTSAIIEWLANSDPRISFEKSNINQGVAIARNRAIAKARGRYLAFLDADDLWEPTKLERQIEFMETNDVSFSFTGYKVISPEGQKLDYISKMPPLMGYKDLLKNTAIACSTVIIDRQKIRDVSFPDMKTRQDFALWLTLLRAGYYAFGMSEVLGSYRIAPNSLSRNKRKAASQVWRVYRETERLPLHRAIWYFSNYAIRGLAKHLRARG